MRLLCACWLTPLLDRVLLDMATTISLRHLFLDSLSTVCIVSMEHQAWLLTLRLNFRQKAVWLVTSGQYIELPVVLVGQSACSFLDLVVY